MATNKKAAKKAVKKVAKKAVKKAAVKRSPVKAAKDAGLTSLLSKIQIELETGKKASFSRSAIAKAQECLNKTGKVVISFKRAKLDGTGTGTGTGTQLID